MNADRRAILRLAGIGVGASIAGCLGGGDPNDGDGDGPNDAETRLSGYDTAPLSARFSSPELDEDGEVGRVVVIDSEDRERAVLDPYDPPEGRRNELDEFLSGIDYERERLLLVESVGPNACHDRVEIDGVAVEDGRIHAGATVVDTSEGDVGCAEAITYPSALVRATFDGEPIDAAAVEITDGWGETATVTADAADPVGSDAIDRDP